MSARDLLRNHFRPMVSVGLVDAVLMGLERKTALETFWKKIGFIPIGDDRFQFEDWIVDPKQSSFSNANYETAKFIQPSRP